MKPPVETVRVSSRSREILIQVKRKTGLTHWNEICRAGLCRSLANPTRPVRPAAGWDTALEIEWKTFAGEHAEAFAALTLIRAAKDRLDLRKADAMADYFRAHLERGISYLKSVQDLRSLAMPEDPLGG